ncbi:MAG: ferric reductase-like transmembrane domain-containing protein [Sulfuricellaceae bacterium]|nr:ferric reductase-like transmembrane domain-containing protein [Sulfuricellaceae bacterium]
MIALTPSPSLRRFGAPLVVIAPTLAVVWWAFPGELTIWRTTAIVMAWAGCGLLVANLVLVIREPHVARLLGGLESTYRWHHRSGLLAYLLLLCHPLALAFDDRLEAPQLAWQTLAPWSQSWPVWLGWAALLLLMAGLLSTFALHLPYRRWRGFHFMLGLGVLLGLAHVYSLLGGENPLIFLMLIAALALSWRLFFSDLGMNAYLYQVTQVVQQASGMIEARLRPRAGAMTVIPGQFILAAFGDGPHYHGCGEYHPFTVSGVEADGDLRVSIKALGPCSQRIQQLEPGVQVRLQGPFGIFLGRMPSAPQLWVAGGIGITPFMAALRAQPCSQPTTLLYLFRSEADAAFLAELNTMANTDPLFELLSHSSDRGRPDFAEILPKISHISAREVYICGPLPMVETLMPILRQSGVAASAIHHERFDFR